MRCPACGEENSDRAVVCELCQAPLRGPHTTGSTERGQLPTPAAVVLEPAAKPPAPTPAAPIAPAPAMSGNGAPPGPKPPVFYLPQPSVKQGPGARRALLVLLVLSGGAAFAYRYWPQPTGPKTASAPAPKAPPALARKAALRVELLPAELPVQPVPGLRPRTDEAAPAPIQPIIEIRPSDPRATRSVSSSWFEGAEGFERAKKEQEYGSVPMIIYFRVDWCPYCRRMDQDIIDSSSVREFLTNVVKVRINPQSSPADDQLARSMGVKGFPSMFVVPHPGSTPERIHSLSRKANEPIDLSVAKFISSAQQAGLRRAHNQMVEGTDKLKRGDTAGARADLDRAIAMNPKSADAYFWRGQADAKAGELGKAVGNFKRALELQPERKDALLALAGLYGKNREYDEAITYLTRAIRIDPGYSQGIAFAQRGYSYKMKGDMDAAKADFAEACKRGTTGACGEAQP
jgi:thioredoxin-like negative regulator of GroEL